MKSIVIIIIILLLAVSSFVFFKINKVDFARGSFLSEAGGSFNNLFKRGTSFVGETVKNKSPEVKEELKKETQEIKSEALAASQSVMNEFKPLDYVKNIVSKFINNDSDESDDCEQVCH